MRARWVSVLVAMVFVGAAACDGDAQRNADPTVDPPSPTPTAEVDDPTPSATPEPDDGEILEGVFETGFEHSGFYKNAVCPEGSGAYWVSWTPDSMFAERLEDESGVHPFSEPGTLAFRVTMHGQVSPRGEYGHLGQYPREVTVFELIDAELASGCGDDDDGPRRGDDVDEPPDSFGPPAVVAFDSGGNEVQLGLGSYCWQSGGGQPGLCADTAGHITNVEPLVVAAGETVFLSSQLVLADADIELRAWSVENDEPLASGPDWLAWRPSDLSKPLAVLVGDVGVAFEANLAPGFYVASAFVVVPQGDVSYGLLLRIEGAAPGDEASLGEPVMLGVGQAVSIAGSGDKLMFSGVVSDSRCPVDVVCVWAGEALLAFELSGENAAVARLVAVGPGGEASAVLGFYRLTVLELEPEPQSTAPTPPGSYEATIVLDRLPPLPSGSGIEGVVTLGPLCPVLRAGVPCPDRVYTATLALLDANGVEVARVTSRTDGYYRLATAPGLYTLVPQSPPGLPLPLAGPIAIEVVVGAWTTADVGYDSGIR
jgi:hypothetical protein